MLKHHPSKLTFNDRCRESFNKLKDCLSREPTLTIYRPGATTELHTDACADGYGAILLQVDPQDNILHPVYYMSRKTSEVERKYSSYELEVLAVIEAVKKFRIYLLGHPFKLVTDCKAFEQTLKKRDLTTRVARWVLLLEEFEYKVEHRRGSQLRHADALSRNATTMIITVDNTVVKQLQNAQKEDDNIQTIATVLTYGPYKNYMINNGLLCKNINGQPLYVVPSAMEDSLIKRIHNQGHFGSRKTQDIVEKEFFIPNVKLKIEICLKNCVECILANRKEGRQEGYLHPIPKNDEPLDTFHVDHLGPLSATSKGYKYIFSTIDAFTKFLWLFPVKSLTADETVQKLKIITAVFGNPNRIIADRGGAFISNEFKSFCKEESIELINITTGVPRGNGQIERAHRIVISTLTKLSRDNPSNWYKHVDRVQCFLNSTYQRSICTSPFRLLVEVNMKLKDDTLVRDIVEKEVVEIFEESRNELREKTKSALLKIQEENRKQFNKRRKVPYRYKVGDLVAIERTQFGSHLKIRSKFLGPYQIVKKYPNDRFDVKKVGEHEGPGTTSTSVDKMKIWSTYRQNKEVASEVDWEEDEASFGANGGEDGRV